MAFFFVLCKSVIHYMKYVFLGAFCIYASYQTFKCSSLCAAQSFMGITSFANPFGSIM